MSSISVFVKGHDHLEKKYKQISVRLGVVTAKQLSEIGKLLKSSLRKKLKKISGSRREKRYSPTRIVTVSNPKSYPNHDRGVLLRGIRANVKKRANGNSVLFFKSTAKYSLDLEFGTRNMRPRPFMRPVLAAHRKRIKAIIAKGVNIAL